MIESPPITEKLMRIDLSKEQYDSLIDGIRSEEYTRDQSYGFVPETIDSEYLTARLVVTTPVAIQVFDENTQSVDDREVDRTELIPFQIDYEHQFLEVFSNQDNTSKVVTRLGHVGDWNISVSEARLPLGRLYKRLRTNPIDFAIQSIRIKDFSLNQHTSGSCHLKVFEEKEATRLLDKYKKNVTYLGTQFQIRNETISIGLYRSGTIQIYSKTDEAEELLVTIKQLLNELTKGDSDA